MERFFKNLAYGLPHSLQAQIDYLPGQAASKTVADNSAFGIILFAVAAGAEINRNASAGDALALVLEGSAHISASGTTHTLSRGEFIIIPKQTPYALSARENFKLLLFVAFQ